MNKKQKQEKYWFILDNYVHISVKKDSAMLYNPLTGNILEYTGKESEAVIKLTKRLVSPKNLLVVGLTEKELSDPGISQFVRDIRGHFMGDLIDASRTDQKPVQVMPYPKVHRDAEKIKETPSRSVGELMMKYLAEISLYINSGCSLDCNICSSAYKQFLCCTRGENGKDHQDMPSLEHLFRQLENVPLTRINILGGDIFKFAPLDPLLKLLKKQPPSREKVFYIHYLNLFQREEQLALFPSPSFLKIPVTFPVKKDQWDQVVKGLHKPLVSNIDIHFLFIVGSETEVTQAEELIDLFHLDNYSFHPFFNGHNRSFFQQNVFLDREDLREAKPTDKEINARQLVNPLQFGKLTVLSNGGIHANVNEPKLGTLQKNTLHQAVYKEMDKGNSWRRIRKKVEPCKQCIFESLCPPLSNYEYALGRNNLCHIR
ncbi:MAG: TIGR04150 pseudo-rSAM protein [bacterium]|nr:TIGR04150 pseudo-rSAM protein [bacterium]